MPELPEVETVRLGLVPFAGWRVRAIRTSGKTLRLGTKIPIKALKKQMVGENLGDLHRLGKYLIWEIPKTDRRLLVHLGMSGRFRIFRPSDNLPDHSHVWWEITSGSKKRILCYSDPRRFGTVDITAGANFPGVAEVVAASKQSRKMGPSIIRDHALLQKLGPDPLVEGIDRQRLMTLASATKRSAKAFLLDQRVLAGVGNIYASEALWRSKIHPAQPCNSLKRLQVNRMTKAVLEVFRFALEKGGTTLRDFVAADGKTGEFSDYLQVYGRDGERCQARGCNGIIERMTDQGRGTFFCPRCTPSP